MWSVDALILYAVIKSASITPMKMLPERDRNTPSLERFILAGWAAAAGRAMDSWGGELAGQIIAAWRNDDWWWLDDVDNLEIGWIELDI